MKTLKFTGAVAAFAVGTALLLAAPPKAVADDGRSRCQQRVEKAEDHYRHEIREHGKHSQKAEEAKAKLNETWNRCWEETHAWYDPNRHEWRTEHDWDHHYDWDRDHDRDDDRR